MTSERSEEETTVPRAGSSLPTEVEERVYAIWFDGSSSEREAELADLCEMHPDDAAAIRALASHLAHGDILLGEVGAAAQVAALITVGPYQLHEEIGTGGFGVVYRAEQTAPVHRTVALKLLHPTRLNEMALARFEVERQTLAAMEHPAIARMYDFGTAPDGRPYFAMELVSGTPITKWCDDNCFDLVARIRLFLRVCTGVHHAHQRGVVHRDIKPSNVLVHDQDGVPAPKIIDFGVAKILDPGIDGGATLEGSLIGTLEYMSPEQAAGLDIDTRTDVFSLGVLLYELLTGGLHFDRESLGAQSLVGFVKQVAEIEPRRPSEAFGAAADVAEVARRRGTPAETVLRQLRNDLDWILLRALSNDREQRYGSVSAFAQDLQRHLDHQPVSARAPTAGYLVRKFARRHRAGVTVVAALVFAVLATFAGVIFGLIEAERERDKAQASSYAAHLAAAHAALDDGDISGLRHHLRDAPERLRGWEWRYLVSRAEESERVLRAGVGDVHDLAATPDGRHVIVAGYLGGIECWNTDRGELAAHSSTDNRIALSLAASPDGRRVAVVDFGGRTTVHEVPSLEELTEFEITTDREGGGIDWSPDGTRLAVGDRSGGFTIHELTRGGAPVRFCSDEDEGIVIVAFDPAGERVAAGSERGTVRVWELSGDRDPYALVGHGEMVHAMQFTPDGKTLYSCAGDGTVRCWDLDTSEAVWVAESPVGRLNSLALIDGGQRVVVAGGYGSPFLGILDAGLGTWLTRSHGHEGGVFGVVALPGGRFATGSSDETVRIWSAAAAQRPTRLDIGRGLGDIAFGPEGRRVVTSSWYGRVALWDHASRTELAHVETGARAVYLAWDGSRARILAAIGGELAVLRDTDLEPVRESVTGLNACTVTVSPARDRVLVGTWDGVLVVLDGDGLFETARVPIGRGAVRSASGPRGARLAAVDAAGHVVVFRDDGAVLHELDGAENNYSLAFAPDGASLAFEGNGQLRIVDLETGATHREFTVPGTLGITWSPDGTRLVTASNDRKVRLYDPERGQLLLALEAGSRGAGYPVFDASGQRLAVVVGGLHQAAQAVIWSAPGEPRSATKR